MMIFPTFWSIGAVMMLSATDPETKIFWFKFLNLFRSYGDGRILLCAPILWAWPLVDPPLSDPVIGPVILSTFFVLTNNIFHRIGIDIRYNGEIIPVHTNVTNLFFFYFVLPVPGRDFVLIRFFIRSPQHRWPVAPSYPYLSFHTVSLSPITFMLIHFQPMDPVILSWNAGVAIYALAISSCSRYSIPFRLPVRWRSGRCRMGCWFWTPST